MESWLIKITNYLLAQSWQIAILVIVIGLISFLLRNKSAHIRYLLWLIVLVKCMVPPLYTIQVAVLPQQDEVLYTPVPPISESIAIAEDTIPEAAVTESAGSVFVEPEEMSTPMVSDKSVSFVTLEWLAIGWIVGIVALSFYYLMNALRTQIWLQMQRKALPDDYKKNIESLFIAHGIRRIPRIWSLERINQPFVWGLVRGNIYMPAKLVDEKYSKFHTSLLGHELSHVIRFDALINSLQVISQAIFWFHPFVWWTNRKIRIEREKCCDEMTIARLNALPEEYSEAIVEILAAKYKQARPVPSLAVAGHVKNIEERIKTMLRPGKKFYKRPSVIAIVVLLLAALFTIPIGCSLIQRSGTETATEQEEEYYESLHEAATAGDLAEVKRLIDEGANVNAQDDTDGLTALHRAIYVDIGMDIITLLVDKGANVNLATKEGWTPLHYAVDMENLDAVRLLVDKWAAYNVKNQEGWTAFSRAALYGRTDMTDLFLARGADTSSFQMAAFIGDLARVRELIEAGTEVDVKDEFGWTALFWAACSGQAEVAEFLIENNADLTVQDGSGRTLLHQAAQAQTDAANLVELLIAKGASVNAKNVNGEVPLILACGPGNENVAKLLIDKGADVNAKNNIGETALHRVALTNHVEVADLLVSKGANVNAELSIQSTRYTPLHGAAMRDATMVEFLIEHGADINACAGSFGRTPFHQAVINGKTDIVRLLIDKGADVNTPDRRPGITPLAWAVQENHTDIIELLREHGAENGSPTLLSAVTFGNIEQVKLLISEETDPNAKNAALQEACSAGELEIVQLLITHGADVNVRYEIGRTLLFSAIYLNDDIDLVNLLLSAGADVNIIDNNRYPPLYYAVIRGNLDMLNLLVENGARFDDKIRNGMTVIQYAVSLGNREIVDVFLSHGVDTLTLPMAACIGDLDRIRSLIAQGVDINAKDEVGWTPLYWATCMGQTEAVELLIANEVDINVENNRGRTPLDLAQQGGQTEIVELLREYGAEPGTGATPGGGVRGGMLRGGTGAELGSSPLHEAAAAGDIEQVKQLISEGAEVNVRDNRGGTPLHDAAVNGQIEVAEFLIENGADVNPRINFGGTPLLLAARNGHQQMVELLIAKGADVNISNNAGITPLDVAERNGNTEIVELLREHGAAE